MSVSVERLLNALWKEPALLREALGVLCIERIAGPWRNVEEGFAWTYERRSLSGVLVARCRLRSSTDKVEVVVPSEAYQASVTLPGAPAAQAMADDVLNKADWLLLTLPTLGPWEEEGVNWVRKTSLGHVAARVRLVSREARQFTLYVVVDEHEAPFEGTVDKAMSVLDRHLEHHGFVLG